MPTVLKSGSLNLLEATGPAQACTGIDLPLHRDKEDRCILHTEGGGGANWIGYVLHRNSLLKHVTEGKIEGRISDGKTRKKTLGATRWY